MPISQFQENFPKELGFMRFFLIISVFYLSFSISAKEKLETKERVEQILPTTPDSGSPWGEISRFNELEILDLVDETSSQARWKEANKEYSSSVDLFLSGSKALDGKLEERKKIVHYEDRYEWQKKQRRENLEKEFVKLQLDLRQTASQKLVKAMNLLDKIENPKVKDSAPFIDLKSGIYREYIKHLEAFKNYLQIIDFTERYISITEGNEKEKEPHRLLALSYEKMELAAIKSKNQDMVFEFKEKKKKHLLRFAELQYGKESKEYQKIEEKVGRDY